LILDRRVAACDVSYGGGGSVGVDDGEIVDSGDGVATGCGDRELNPGRRDDRSKRPSAAHRAIDSILHRMACARWAARASVGATFFPELRERADVISPSDPARLIDRTAARPEEAEVRCSVGGTPWSRSSSRSAPGREAVRDPP
jgi:hypothetical protein